MRSDSPDASLRTSTSDSFAARTRATFFLDIAHASRRGRRGRDRGPSRGQAASPCKRISTGWPSTRLRVQRLPPGRQQRIALTRVADRLAVRATRSSTSEAQQHQPPAERRREPESENPAHRHVDHAHEARLDSAPYRSARACMPRRHGEPPSTARVRLDRVRRMRRGALVVVSISPVQGGLV